MTTSADFPAAPGRSPLKAAAGVWAMYAFVLPLIEWISAFSFRSPYPTVPGYVWVGFTAMLAGMGLLAGALTYAAARLSRGWIRSYLLGIVFAMAISADAQQFAWRTVESFVVRWLIGSLVTGLVLGVVIHLVDGRRRTLSG